METTSEHQRKQMKEDIIKLFLSIHSSSSRSPPLDSKSSPQTEKLKRLIKEHLPSMFNANRIILTHPPYAVMILEAIKNLKEKGDYTNKISLSNYISTNFEGLPWAASQFLNHHLEKLVLSGEIRFVPTNSTYHLREEQEEDHNPNPSPTRQKKDSSSQKPKRKRKASVKEGITDMVPVSPSVDDANGLDERQSNQEMTVIDVEPLQKQMPETNHIEESAVEKHHGGTVKHPKAEKTLLVYYRRRKRSRPLMTSSTEIQKHQENMSESPVMVAGANDNDGNSGDNDRLTMTVHTPNDTDGNAHQNNGMMVVVPSPKRKRGRIPGKGKEECTEKWKKFQQSWPRREFRPRRVPAIPSSPSKSRRSA